MNPVSLHKASNRVGCCRCSKSKSRPNLSEKRDDPWLSYKCMFTLTDNLLLRKDGLSRQLFVLRKLAVSPTTDTASPMYSRNRLILTRFISESLLLYILLLSRVYLGWKNLVNTSIRKRTRQSFYADDSYFVGKTNQLEDKRVCWSKNGSARMAAAFHFLSARLFGSVFRSRFMEETSN